MGLLKLLKDSIVTNRKTSEELHAFVLQELESGVRRDGLWAKAITITNGNDENRILAEYIRLAVKDLKDMSYIEDRCVEIAFDKQEGYEEDNSDKIDQYNKLQDDSQSYGYATGFTSDLQYKKDALNIKSRKKDIILLINEIETNEDNLTPSRISLLIEYCNGRIVWEDAKDIGIGCTVTLNNIDRSFDNLKSLRRWCSKILTQRVRDYLSL